MDIHEIKFFEGIDAQAIKEIETGCTRETYEEGTVIFKKGGQADFLYILEQGSFDLLIKEYTSH